MKLTKEKLTRIMKAKMHTNHNILFTHSHKFTNTHTHVKLLLKDLVKRKKKKERLSELWKCPQSFIDYLQMD